MTEKMTPEEAVGAIIKLHADYVFNSRYGFSVKDPTQEQIDIIKTQRAQAVEETKQWRPIETAPNDGTRVLLWRDGWCMAPLDHWGENQGDDGVFFGWCWDEAVYVSGACEAGFVGWQEDIDGDLMPTHWLPEPTNE